ncbi:MAG: RpiB/LacA/LacB family sugar-phosphate isomerase [Patescibacteria group bacterium]|nr:RpiB/LacA/LacB family sugar-phosphate isomerase [Patescibacteria group bacterium]MCL5261880.1 RpiB/LacA/LacB family sugar-phosphate isomerase [Patescibacteria group bacterium]
MVIYIGADHRGFNLKESLKVFLKDLGYTVVDEGNAVLDPNDDYPDFAAKLSKEAAIDPDNRRGILVCGSGVGVDVVANKFKNIRSALITSPDQAYMSRNDDDTNVLSLAADITDDQTSKKIVSVWLQTPFSGEEKHRRRIQKIKDIESSLGM